MVKSVFQFGIDQGTKNKEASPPRTDSDFILINKNVTKFSYVVLGPKHFSATSGTVNSLFMFTMRTFFPALSIIIASCMGKSEVVHHFDH